MDILTFTRIIRKPEKDLHYGKYSLGHLQMLSFIAEGFLYVVFSFPRDPTEHCGVVVSTNSTQ